ncbi:hypothetical protein [Paenibacillus sp. O199]|uniref:hypothetical protein n=1 Tax=Paenibacillus sp. O199 TaxID=1643925 RepID=UPI0013747426|nr:hypothetical protein [Paenibacillus sp. O199]
MTYLSYMLPADSRYETTTIGGRSVTQAATSREKNKNDLTTWFNRIIVIVVNRNDYY